MRRCRNIVLLVALAGLMLLAIGTGIVASRSPSSALTIRFVGFTNRFEDGQRAVFSISNSSRRAIGYAVMPVQVDQGLGWPVADRQMGSGLVIHPTPPETTKMFSVPVPTNGISWRVPIWWDYEPSRIEWAKAVVSQNFHALKSGRPWLGLNVGIARDGSTNYTEPRSCQSVVNPRSGI